MATVLLANALRKDAHLRARAHVLLREEATPLQAGAIKSRAEPSRRYVDGMRDLLRVLFADGHALAEACLAEAYARALDTSAPAPTGENGRRGH